MQQQSEISENGDKKERIKRKNMVKYTIFFFIVVLIVLTISIFHIFGPYNGKVVDLETGAPIEGAAVLMCFYTEGGLFDSSRWYADAVETITNNKGEFRIRSQWVFVFHPLSVWKPDGYITVFKPGYGVYPGHDDSGPLFVPNGTIPKKEYVTIKLPKMETLEERRINLRRARLSGSIPERKAKILLELIGEEEVNIGLKE